jgi:hypothetical protein
MSREVGLFGLRPAPLGHKWALQMSSYMDLSALDPIPAGSFGHTKLVTKPWLIYKNDTLGCCVVSGKQHILRLWLAEGTGSDTITFSDDTTVKNYELLGHYNPENPDSDQGCDMLYAAEKWMRHGIYDDTGKLHKIGIALELESGPGYLNMAQFWYANYFFDGVGLGIGVTPQMQQAFQDEQPWDASTYSPYDVVGGHFVPAVAREDDDGNYNAEAITWAEPQAITPDGLQAMTNTVLVYASQEKLSNGKDLEGLSWSDMRSDAKKLNRFGALQGIHRL